MSLLSFLSVQNGNVTESPDRITFGSLFLNCMLVYMKSWLYYVETEVVRCVAGIRKFENPFHSERRIIKHHNNAFFFFLRARSMWLAEHNPDLSRLVVLFWYLRKGRHNKKLNLQLERLLRVFGAVSSYKNHGEMYEKGLCPTIWGKEIIL